MSVERNFIATCGQEEMMGPNPTGTTDAEVIGASLGEPELFATIFDRHVACIHRFLARRIGAEGADALTGESFRIAFERRTIYRLDRPDARPWLYGIAGNVLRQHRRGELRRITAGHRAGGAAARDASPHDAMPDRLDAEAAWPAVQVALAAMRPEERDVILLVAWEDLTYDEVAVALDVPLGTVRSRLHRARRRLRTDPGLREQLGLVGQEEGTPPTSNARYRP